MLPVLTVSHMNLCESVVMLKKCAQDLSKKNKFPVNNKVNILASKKYVCNVLVLK